MTTHLESAKKRIARVREELQSKRKATHKAKRHPPEHKQKIRYVYVDDEDRRLQLRCMAAGLYFTMIDLTTIQLRDGTELSLPLDAIDWIFDSIALFERVIGCPPDESTVRIIAYAARREMIVDGKVVPF